MTKDSPYGIQESLLSRRRFLALGGMAVGGAVLAACGAETAVTTLAGGTATTATGAPSTNGSGIPTTSRSSITIGYNNPNRALRAPMYVAQDKGYFAEVGIEKVEISDADDPVPPTFAGTFDVALFDSEVLFGAANASGEDLKYLACTLGGEYLILGGAPGIKTVDDLRGKTVSAARAGLRNELLTKYMLTQLGLDPEKDVNLVSLSGGSDAWVQAMLTGQVDATVMFLRHKAPVIEAGGVVLYDDLLPTPQGGWAMMQKVIDEDPEFPEAFLYAYIKASRFVKTLDNLEEVKAILANNGVDLPPGFDENYADELVQLSSDLGWDPTEMDRLVDDSVDLGVLPEDIDWRSYTDVSYLAAAQKKLDLPVNPSLDLQSGVNSLDNF